jgi:hypothetical protein
MAQPDSPERPARYGPFHRLESPTQTREDAEKQVASGEIWGRTPMGSGWPQVQAYHGSLPDRANGVEFYTDVEPDEGGPTWALRWSGGGRRPDIRTEDAFAKLAVVITLVRYGAQG